MPVPVRVPPKAVSYPVHWLRRRGNSEGRKGGEAHTKVAGSHKGRGLGYESHAVRITLNPGVSLVPFAERLSTAAGSDQGVRKWSPILARIFVAGRAPGVSRRG